MILNNKQYNKVCASCGMPFRCKGNCGDFCSPRYSTENKRLCYCLDCLIKNKYFRRYKNYVGLSFDEIIVACYTVSDIVIHKL